MKVKEAKNKLSVYQGNELYQEACKLYQEETDYRIQLRAHGKHPSKGLIESVVNEMKPWMEKVGAELPWNDNGLVQKIIEWETAKVWVKYKMTDPRVDEYIRHARLEILKGTPSPLAKALTSKSLEAIGSMIVAQLQQEAEYLLANKEKKQK